MYKNLLAVSMLTAASAALFSESPSDLKVMWENYKAKFAKRYDTMDNELHRYNNFVESLKIADARNLKEVAAGGSAVHGVTVFSDMSQYEFESTMLGANPPSLKENRTVLQVDRPVDADMGLVDWTDVHTTAVKDQGYCGSCWAFAATEQIESDSSRLLGYREVLSPQQIVSCDPVSYGCSGGWQYWAYNYVQSAGGLEKEVDYPYSSYYGTSGTCAANKSLFVVTVSSYSFVQGETSMASYVQSTGPLSIAVDASLWSSYTGGVMSICGKSINHAVQAVGVDASTGGFWKVRNSWNTNWGEAGFIRLAYGKDTCGLTYSVTSTVVSKL